MGVITTSAWQPEMYVDLQDPETRVWHLAIRGGQATRCSNSVEGLAWRRVNSRPAPPESQCPECWIMLPERGR